MTLELEAAVAKLRQEEESQGEEADARPEAGEEAP